MDPVSHVVIGCGLASLLKPTPDVRARGLAAALGALSPDIDVALMPIAWDRYIVAHEIGTHSAIGAALCGVAAAGVTRLVQRQARFAGLLAIAVAGA
jgi:LexA-binding, inner membrane-associated putative hydrolase